MQCYVYKGDQKDDYYVYLTKELDQRAPEKDVPSAILALLGKLSLVLEFDLTPERVLSQADATQVLQDLEQQGFYLQMPKKDMQLEEARYFN